MFCLFAAFLYPCFSKRVAFSFSFSGVGVCTDNHNRGGNDGNGGRHHMSAESLQTLCTVLHQSAQPRAEERGEPIIGKEALPAQSLFYSPIQSTLFIAYLLTAN